MEQDKLIKLVVAEGHTLGYVNPELPQQLSILRASTLMGSPYSEFGGAIMLPKDHRLASAQDFENFNISSVGYLNPDEYEYDNTAHTVQEAQGRFYKKWNCTLKRWETDFNHPIWS